MAQESIPFYIHFYSYTKRLEDSQEDKHYVHIKLGDLYRQVNNYDKAIYHFSQSLLVSRSRSIL